ncbi:hypothetical protein EYB26_001740 [Talaromyces marneffei]|uniref:uncharacterized protein n=1 Tax=Talaromyces marneffei TaxID=37727 RepID=UPI0012A90D34|nr:uncharacterized protein EYB26_001740 [Talaromyces marneffei]QGA14087.1 hypothetical protein EYB26_001740 [Talaromyces marneffei]
MGRTDLHAPLCHEEDVALRQTHERQPLLAEKGDATENLRRRVRDHASVPPTLMDTYGPDDLHDFVIGHIAVGSQHIRQRRLPWLPDQVLLRTISHMVQQLGEAAMAVPSNLGDGGCRVDVPQWLYGDEAALCDAMSR